MTPPTAAHDATMLPALYGSDRWFWWSVGMRAISHALLAGQPLPPGPIVEIGCGGGTFSAEMAAHFPQRQIIGLDLSPVALAYTRQRYPNAVAPVRADLHHLPLRSGSCAALIALDSFDQQAVRLDDGLAEARRVLRPGGLLLLRVSAYPWLLGPHDRAFGTGRRYASSTLAEGLQAAGFAIQRLTHANALLLLPAIAARLAQRRGTATVEEQLHVPAALNHLFALLLHAEAAWLRHRSLAAGLSLYALARAPMGTERH